PSQAPAMPEPTTDPDAEQPPIPEAASTPTDITAPAAPLPALDTPIEREAPESLQLLTLGASFTLTNAEGQTLTHGGSGISGTMAYTQQQLPDAGGDVFSVLIPYSTGFTLETSEVSGDWGFEILAAASPWCHCVARGSGKLEGFEYGTGSRLTVRTEPGAKLDLTLPMPDSGLGESGWICLRLTAGESEVSLTTEGSSFSFSGVDTGAPVLVDYGGLYSANGLDLTPKSSSGSASFGITASGTVGFTAS
ncbi:MAG: hypothetical protein NC319_08090, partial [Butyricicoccus sp.]|nr:hypothetical protein [Butyricicoccus sp.]